MVTAAMKLKDACSLLEKLWPIRHHIKKQRHYFANKNLSSQSYGFSSSHEWMWELDYKESWVPKNWCFWTVVLEKTLESPLDCKEIKAVHPKGNHPWIFIGRTDAITKGVGDGQGSLRCCSPWGHKESDMTEWLNWTYWRNINYFNWIN